MHKTCFQFLSSLYSVPMLIGIFSPHFLIFLPVKWTHQNEGTVIIVLVEIAWLSFTRILYTSWVALYSVVCQCVSVSGIGNTRPNLHFFQYIQAYKPFADHVPPNIKQYQLILTKYQPVSSFTDPVPSSTTYNSSFDESRTVYLV